MTTRRPIVGAVLAMVALLLGLLGRADAQLGAVNLRTSPKGTTPAGTPTSTAVDANTQALDVNCVQGCSGSASSSTTVVQPDGTLLKVTVVNGSLSVTQVGTWNIGAITSITNPVAVTGTFWQATQPISATSLPLPTDAATATLQGTGNASLASIDGKITAVNTGAVVIASGSLTANAGSNLNTSLLALEAGGNLATVATNTTGVALDASVLTNKVAAGTTAPSKLAVIAGRTTDTPAQYQPLPLSNGGQAVNVAVTNAPTTQVKGAVTIANTKLQPIPVDIRQTIPLAADQASLAVVTQDAVGVTASLGAQDAAATVRAAGRKSVGVFIYPGTLAGTLVAECSMDGGVTWTGSWFDQQNASKVSSVRLDGGPATSYQSTLVAMGGCSDYRVRVLSYVAGTAQAFLRATFADDPSVLFAAPPGSVNSPPASAVVSGIDPTGTVRTLAMGPGGVLYTQPSNVSLLPPCNPVRRVSCR